MSIYSNKFNFFTFDFGAMKPFYAPYPYDVTKLEPSRRRKKRKEYDRLKNLDQKDQKKELIVMKKGVLRLGFNTRFVLHDQRK